MKYYLSIFLIATVLCFAVEAKPVSAAMQKILKKYKASKHDLNLNGMTPLKKQPDAYKKVLAKKNIEIHVIKPPQNVADGFSYKIVYDPDTKTFWINRTGGFAGFNHLYGPLKL
jgi:hypothetical protein